VKKTIRDLNFSDCQNLALEILRDPSRENVQKIFRQIKSR